MQRNAACKQAHSGERDTCSPHRENPNHWNFKTQCQPIIGMSKRNVDHVIKSERNFKGCPWWRRVLDPFLTHYSVRSGRPASRCTHGRASLRTFIPNWQRKMSGKFDKLPTKNRASPSRLNFRQATGVCPSWSYTTAGDLPKSVPFLDDISRLAFEKFARPENIGLQFVTNSPFQPIPNQRLP